MGSIGIIGRRVEANPLPQSAIYDSYINHSVSSKIPLPEADKDEKIRMLQRDLQAALRENSELRAELKSARAILSARIEGGTCSKNLIGQPVDSIRRALGYSIPELAKLAHMRAARYSKCKNGYMNWQDADKEKVAGVFGMKAGDIDWVTVE